MVSVEKMEYCTGIYFVGGHTVRIDHGRVIIGDVRSYVTLPVDELLAIAELIKEQTL